MAFAIATTLNFVLVAVQVFYGITANSVALLADAGHNLSDVLALPRPDQPTAVLGHPLTVYGNGSQTRGLIKTVHHLVEVEEV